MAAIRARSLVLGIACSFSVASAGEATSAGNKCCYSGPTDCDGPRDWCATSEAHCTDCGGKLYNATDANATHTAGGANVTLLVTDNGNSSNWQKYVPEKYRHYMNQHRRGEAEDRSRNNTRNWEKYVPAEYRTKAEEDERKEKQQENTSNSTANASDALLLSSESSSSQNKSSWDKYVPAEYQQYAKHQHDNASQAHNDRDNSTWEKYVPKEDRKYAQRRRNSSDNESSWEKYVPKAYRKQAEEDDQKQKELTERENEASKNRTNAASATMLYGSHCNRVTGGTCKYIRCRSSRGPTTCISGKCLCQPGYHAVAGKCLPGCGAMVLLADPENEPAPEFLAVKRQESGTEVPVSFAGILAAGLSLLVLSRVWYARRVHLPAALLG